MKSPVVTTDFHSHILPRMDDGADSLQTAAGQLGLLKKQGIATVFATPHFYLHREDAASFLARRADRYEQLREYLREDFPDAPAILPGAEVHLEQGLREEPLERLTLGESGYVLFEIPYTGYRSWMAAEIHNLCYSTGVKPMLAHLERYMSDLDEADLEELLSLEDVVVQINSSAFDHRSGTKFALELIGAGIPLVLGSDTHNLTSRRPDFSAANKVLGSKLKARGFSAFIEQSEALLSGL